MRYDTIIVGGGIAGLTAQAYLQKAGFNTLLIEKQEEIGGLVSSFNVKGYLFDGGIRSIENSGIVQPMLNELGIDIEFLPSIVSLGIEKDYINIRTEADIEDYQELLVSKFPNDKEAVINIVKEVRKVMKYLDILYGIDNPLFLPYKEHKKYYMKTIFPWMFKFLFTFRKIEKLTTPIDEYLLKFTSNQALIDTIAQHFFYKTPAFFALSYFSLYLDYRYPKGGTGTLVHSIEEYILKNKGEIKLNTMITDINVLDKYVVDNEGQTYHYDKLIWAADSKFLYKNLDVTQIKNKKQKEKVKLHQQAIKELKGGDSIQTIFVGTDLTKDYFKDKCTGHFFYTPYTDGLGDTLHKRHEVDFKNKEETLLWMKKYFKYTTYEIAIPGLRDESVTNNGKISMVISTLMDYSIVKTVKEQGWYDEYKKISEKLMLETLEETKFTDLQKHIKLQFSSTPLTVETRTNNTDGAITGWAFDNKIMPAVTSLPGVAKSVNTPIPDVIQAGQWSYSPAGLPISILTGKLASNKAIKELKKRKRT